MLFARQMEVFAGFGEHTDHEVGRLVAAIEAMGEMDNTLFTWTKQVASNFAIANSPGAVVLPWPEHACHDPAIDAGRAEFLHFVGTHRFERGTYAALSRAAIAAMPRIDDLRG